MNKKLIGIAGIIYLGAILAGCGQVSQSAASVQTKDETQSVQQTAPAAVSQPEVNTEEPESASPAFTASETLTTGEEATNEVERADKNVNASLSSIEIPKPVNPLSEGEYRWSQLLARDAIFPVYNPEFAPANEAPYDDDELVIGVAINGEAKAYAIGPLNGREMVNDTLGGVPILVTW
jgi:hypothetical protein